MAAILISGNVVALVDDEDIPRVNGFTWSSIYKDGIYYAVHTRRRKPGIERTAIYMHCLILDWYGGIDHADGDGLNNQRVNLRRCTSSQNGGNRRKQSGTSSQYKGVSWNTGKQRWRAHIQIDKKPIHLGWFTEEATAARAYNEAAITLFKDFARINRIEDGSV